MMKQESIQITHDAKAITISKIARPQITAFPITGNWTMAKKLEYAEFRV
jgi:hypothetical protein